MKKTLENQLKNIVISLLNKGSDGKPEHGRQPVDYDINRLIKNDKILLNLIAEWIRIMKTETEFFQKTQFITDMNHEEYGLKNIRRQLYRVFEVKMVLPKRERGGEVDRILTSAIKKLRETGRYKEQ